jgi:hypothetical protein
MTSITLIEAGKRMKLRIITARLCCNTPKKPHHSKVENSIIKNKEFSHEKIWVISLNLVLAGLRLGLKNRQVGEKWFMMIVPIYAKVSINICITIF